MIPPLHIQTIAETSAAHIAASLVEGTLTALLAALTLRLTRRHSSSARFAVWFSALVTIAALPLVSGIALTHHSSAPLNHSAVTLPAAWALYVSAAWVIVATFFLARIIVSLVRVRALRQACVPVDPAQLDPSLRETLRHSNNRTVTLCTSDEIHVPTAIGFFQPAVVIPTWLLDSLSAGELNQIVLHELAHLSRRDDWTNLAQQLIKALFFFHPAVWWIEKKLSLEREIACDDAVLAATSQPRAYAECLAHLAERTFIRRTLALAHAALGRVRHMSLRVAEILNPNRQPAAKQNWKPALSLVAAFAIGSVTLASRAPQLIVFRDSGDSLMASSGLAGRNTRGGADALVRPVERSSTAAAALDSSVSTTLKPIRASFTPPPAFATNQKVMRKLPAAAKPLNLSAERTPVIAGNSAQGIFAFVITSETLDPTLVHPANFAARPVSSETIFVILQAPGANPHESAAGQPILQIHFWRVTVFHPAQFAVAKIPNKET